MSPDVVADVGNSLIKWGRCRDGRVTEKVSLPPDDPAAWHSQLAFWGLASPAAWAVSGVHPPRRQSLTDWLRQRGHQVLILEHARQLPLRVDVEFPDRVGIDRLLNAVAARALGAPDSRAVIADAGSAVTVDLVDESGTFFGGTIFPGLRLMAQALHTYTALLPLVKVAQSEPPLPGRSTPEAIAAGVFWAVAGGIRALVEELSAPDGHHAHDVYLTGGDAPLLEPVLRRLLATVPNRRVLLAPSLTLEGVRLAAEANA